MAGAGDLLGLQDAKVLVTGAGAGLGKATALIYAEAGAQVACCDREVALAEATAQEIAAQGGQAFALSVDVTDKAQVWAMVAEVEARFGSLDVAVNVVGGLGGLQLQPFMDMSLDDWEHVVRLNLTSAMLCCQAEGVAMARRGAGGRIVNFASGAALKGSPGMAQYGAAKAGIIQLTKTLALEYADYGIRVNCVVPGTHWTASVERKANDPVHGASFRDFIDRTSKFTPMKRMGENWETAGAALYLGSRLSSYVTGHIVVSDGGATHTTARGDVAEGQKPRALQT
jgi:NAD(P)-dependent dehydrogenase (short-subunit alcohol dehydrogenase family)